MVLSEMRLLPVGYANCQALQPGHDLNGKQAAHPRAHNGILSSPNSQPQALPRHSRTIESPYPAAVVRV